MAISEYDAFGPWIYEVDGEHPLPRLFAPYVRKRVDALMLLKIPRDIERRRATPDMELYDYVVGAYEERVVLLKRHEAAVQRTEVLYREIEGLALYRYFLQGNLMLYTAKGEVCIPFNTVSMSIMQRFVSIIRARYQTARRITSAVLCVGDPKDIPDLDVLFINLLRDMEGEGETARVGAFQPEAPLASAGRDWLQKIVHPLSLRTMPSMLHMVNHEELILIRRGKEEKRAKKNEFSYEFTYIPLGNIHAIRVQEEEQYEDILRCTLDFGRHQYTFLMRGDNQGVVGFYDRLAKQLHLQEKADGKPG